MPDRSLHVAVNAWAAAISARYGAVLLGIAIGTAAKYGLALSEGRMLTWRGAVVDVLLMGMVCLLALVAVDQLKLTGTSATLCAALFAISSDRVVRLVKERFLRRVDASLQADIELAKGEMRQLVQTELSAQRVIDDHTKLGKE